MVGRFGLSVDFQNDGATGRCPTGTGKIPRQGSTATTAARCAETGSRTAVAAAGCGAASAATATTAGQISS
jgi:hypothetical protein